MSRFISMVLVLPHYRYNNSISGVAGAGNIGLITGRVFDAGRQSSQFDIEVS
ncbi:hypothetical protein PSI19_19055 [Xenorhabdus khoisanae]|nr:hypothetical protein [Xenorhabdus khoisanae]